MQRYSLFIFILIAGLFPLGCAHGRRTSKAHNSGSAKIEKANASSLANGGRFAEVERGPFNQGEYASTFNPTLKSWMPAGKKVVPKDLHVAVELLDGNVFTLQAGEKTGAAEVYSVGAESWHPVADPIFPVIAPVAVRLQDGRILVLGKEASQTGPSEDFAMRAQIYDSNFNSWSLTGQATFDREEPSATVLGNGKVLLLGGKRFQKTEKVEVYDPARTVWRVEPSTEVLRDQLQSTLLLDGRVLVVGGTSDKKTEIFDPQSHLWSTVAPISTARQSGHSLTLLNDGRVLLLGGVSESGEMTASAEVFYPASGQWSTISRMPSPRKNHQAVLLNDGKVLVAGGILKRGKGSSAWLYDPALDKWTDVSPKTHGVATHAKLTVLKNGKVLVSGGSNQKSPALCGANCN